MRHHRLLSLTFALAIGCSVSMAERPLDLVDTRVGTDAAVTKTAGLFGKGSEEHGQTLPAVGVPHGMNLWTPQTRDTEQKCIAPYYGGHRIIIPTPACRDSATVIGLSAAAHRIMAP